MFYISRCRILSGLLSDGHQRKIIILNFNLHTFIGFFMNNDWKRALEYISIFVKFIASLSDCCIALTALWNDDQAKVDMLWSPFWLVAECAILCEKNHSSKDRTPCDTIICYIKQWLITNKGLHPYPNPPTSFSLFPNPKIKVH